MPLVDNDQDGIEGNVDNCPAISDPDHIITF